MVTDPDPRPAAEFRLIEGAVYRFNFGGSPSGIGDFRGYVAVAPGLPQWLAFENVHGDKSGEIVFRNPALICNLTRIPDPRL